MDKDTIKKRMQEKPPEHKYDSNVKFLLKVQKEYLRLIKKEKTLIINTANKNISESTKIILNKIKQLQNN